MPPPLDTALTNTIQTKRPMLKVLGRSQIQLRPFGGFKRHLIFEKTPWCRRAIAFLPRECLFYFVTHLIGNENVAYEIGTSTHQVSHSYFQFDDFDKFY